MKGVFSILQVVFIILKLVHAIDWPWWLVLLPLWIYLGILVLVFIVTFIMEILNG